MVTIYDVAEKAGVSPATVSRVLNCQANVRPETQSRVRRACRELNYVPNANAGSLKKKTTRTLALIIPEVQNPFFISILRGFEEVAVENGYNLIFCNTDEMLEKEENYIQMLLEKRIDGLAVSTASSRGEHLQKVQNHRVPLVLLDRRVDGLEVDVVCGDSLNGASILVNHLIDLGHERIAMISAPVHLSTARDRVEGYRRALEEAGLGVDERLLRIDSRGKGYSRERAYELGRELLSTSRDVTAVFVANNFMALGVYEALREEGLRVPDDMAIVCFDDLNLELELNPFFTVMKQPAYTMGNIAAQILVNKLDGEYEQNRQEVVLQPELVVRRSSGKKVKMQYKKEALNIAFDTDRTRDAER